MTPFDLQTNDIKFSHSSTGSMSSAHVPPPVTTPAAHVHDPEYQNLYHSSNDILHKYYTLYILVITLVQKLPRPPRTMVESI